MIWKFDLSDIVSLIIQYGKQRLNQECTDSQNKSERLFSKHLNA